MYELTDHSLTIAETNEKISKVIYENSLVSSKNRIDRLLYNLSQFKPSFSEKLFGNYEERIITAFEHLFKNIEQINHLSNKFDPTSEIGDFEIKILRVSVQSNVPRSIEVNRIQTYKIDCHVRFEEESEEKTILLDFPEYINGTFTLNSVIYTPLFQIADKGSYVGSKNKLILKTLQMPVILVKRQAKINNPEYIHAVKIKVFKSIVNVLVGLNYNSAKDCLSFYGLESDEYEFFNEKPNIKLKAELESKSQHVFQFRNKYFYVFKKMKDVVVETICEYLFSSNFKSKEEICSENSNLEIKRKIFKSKIRTLNLSLERILDPITASNLVHIDPKDKQSIHHVIRWMTYYYNELYCADTLHFDHKRLKLEEYLLSPISYKLSDAIFRVFNSSKRNQISLKRLSSTLTFPQDYLIKKLISESLIRPISVSNGVLAFQKFKATVSTSNGNEVSTASREQHETSIGHIGSSFASSSDPGKTLTICPYTTVDEDGFYDRSIKLVTPY